MLIVRSSCRISRSLSANAPKSHHVAFHQQRIQSNQTRYFSSGGGVKCLVVAEHDFNANKNIVSGTLNCIRAAQELGGEVNILLAGDFKGSKDIAKQISKLNSVSKIFLADRPFYKQGLAESLSLLVKNCAQKWNPTHILAPASTFGKNLMPRVASLLDVSPISDVTAIKSPDTFKRPTYAGNVLTVVKSLDPLKILTVRATAFEKAKEGTKEAEVIPLPSDIETPEFKNSQWIRDEVKESTRPELTTARTVVSGGRGMANGQNFQMLEKLADLLGGAVGASRAAVDAGFVSNDLQVGQTGKIVAPELYIAVGISGAIQHLAGMKDSKVIVAINKDAEAPIFGVADFGIVGDLFQVIPEFTQEVKAAKGQA